MAERITRVEELPAGIIIFQEIYKDNGEIKLVELPLENIPDHAMRNITSEIAFIKAQMDAGNHQAIAKMGFDKKETYRYGEWGPEEYVHYKIASKEGLDELELRALSD